MKTVRIEIPDMQSSHCQIRVRTVLTSLNGVTVTSVEPGSASVNLEDGAELRTVTESIEKSGYTVAGVGQEISDETKTTTFKTNINCSGCVAKASPVLNEVVGEGNWSVETERADKKLTITSEAFDGEDLGKRLKDLGLEIEAMA